MSPFYHHKPPLRDSTSAPFDKSGALIQYAMAALSQLHGVLGTRLSEPVEIDKNTEKGQSLTIYMYITGHICQPCVK